MQKESNNNNTSATKAQPWVLNKIGSSLHFFKKKLFPTQNEILDQQLRIILQAYNSGNRGLFVKSISKFEARRNIPFDLASDVTEVSNFIKRNSATSSLRINFRPADKSLITKTVEAVLESLETTSREHTMKLLRFHQLAILLDGKFAHIFITRGGYEVLNRLLTKWNDQEFLTHIVVAFASSFMFGGKSKVEDYYILKENIVDHALRCIESPNTSEAFITQVLLMLFVIPDKNYDHSVQLAILSLAKYSENRRILRISYLVLGERVTELFTKFAPKLKDVLRPLFTSELIHVTKDTPVQSPRYLFDENAQLLLAPEYTCRLAPPDIETAAFFFLEMVFMHLIKHDSPDELKYFLDNRLFALILKEVQQTFTFSAVPFRVLRVAIKFMPTAYYMDIISITKTIILTESKVDPRHQFNVLFSALQFMDENTIKEAAEETISTVFDKIEQRISDKRVMLAGITLLRLFFSTSAATEVEHHIKSKGTSVFLKMVKRIVADKDKDRMIELLILLKESATFSQCCREFFVSKQFVSVSVDVINTFLGQTEVLNKLIRVFVNSVSQNESLFNQLFESPMFGFVTSLMTRYPKDENILDAGCKFLATYGLFKLGLESAYALNIGRVLYDIIKDIDSPVVLESALFTFVFFLNPAGKSDPFLTNEQVKVLNRRLVTVFCRHHDRPELFKTASKLLHFISVEDVNEDSVKELLDGIDEWRTRPIDGRETPVSHLIGMLANVTSSPSMKDSPLNDRAYDFIMDVLKNNLDEAFRLRAFAALSEAPISVNIGNITRLMDRGILPILLEYIEQHLQYEDLGYAYNVMAKLCAIPENIPVVADRGMPLIFRSFQEQKQNDSLHHYGLKALAMMSQSDAIKRRFGRVSIALTLESMSTFINVPEIVINGTVALFNLAVGSSPSVRIDVHTLHGISVIMNVLRHRLPLAVKNNAILLLRVLCSYDENCVDFLEENGLEDLLAVAKQFPEDKTLVSEILVTIGVVVEAEYKNSQLLDYLKQSGEQVIQFAKNALKMPLEIKMRAANLISDLSFHNFLVGSILSNGGLGAILDCYSMHGDDVSLMANVLRSLLNCSRAEAFYSSVSVTAINTVIIPMMMKHLDDHIDDEETSFNQMYPAGFFANLVQFGGDYRRWTLNLPQLTARILLVIEKHSSHAQLLYHCFRLVRDLAKDPSVVPLVVEKIEILMTKLKDANFHIEALQATGLELMAQLCNNEVGKSAFVSLGGVEWMEQLRTEFAANQRICTAHENITKLMHK